MFENVSAPTYMHWVCQPPHRAQCDKQKILEENVSSFYVHKVQCARRERKTTVLPWRQGFLTEVLRNCNIIQFHRITKARKLLQLWKLD